MVVRERIAELEQLGVLDDELPGEPQQLIPPRKLAADEKLKAIRKLREKGLTQRKFPDSWNCRQALLGDFGTLMIDQNVRGLAMTWAVQTLRSRPLAGSYAINKGGILDTDPT